MILQHHTGPIGIQKAAQIIDLNLDLPALVGLGNLHAAFQRLKNSG